MTWHFVHQKQEKQGLFRVPLQAPQALKKHQRWFKGFFRIFEMKRVSKIQKHGPIIFITRLFLSLGTLYQIWQNKEKLTLGCRTCRIDSCSRPIDRLQQTGFQSPFFILFFCDLFAILKRGKRKGD
jgi:hypothetical protein